ncbi:formyltransferase family protein [Neoroseomonas soli]|uniref:Formyl transferase n=1 Tax=Neoroseomonas soli TaxID=1081025 RepID=A0A9X9X4N9_9PROT|nr:formyltransferase family protein [Neoroseomonas soli]MBR0674368.1 formyl transferase [Neoroseomonas soli]
MTLRIALLTLESTASAEAAARVLRETTQDVVFLGVSDPFRGGTARTRELFARCGPRILPWLFVEFAAPRLLRARGTGPLAAAAAARGLRATVVPDINEGHVHLALEASRPDLIVTCHFDQILSPATIALATRGGVNLHPSLLPLHRGPMPCFWAAADGNGEFGVTVHRLVPRIDAGAILAQRAVTPPPHATVSATARALHMAGAEMLLRVIEDIAAERERGREAPTMPYRSFPDRAALATAARNGVRLTGFGDLRAARRLGGVAA